MVREDLFECKDRASYEDIHGKSMSGEFPGGLTVKDPALSLLWQRFDPCPRELLHALGTAKKERKRRKERKREREREGEREKERKEGRKKREKEKRHFRQGIQ